MAGGQGRGLRPGWCPLSHPEGGGAGRGPLSIRSLLVERAGAGVALTGPGAGAGMGPGAIAKKSGGAPGSRHPPPSKKIDFKTRVERVKRYITQSPPTSDVVYCLTGRQVLKQFG